MSPSTKTIEQRQETRTSYNKLSRWYDLMAGGYESKYSMQGIKLLNPQPGDSILEVGFGTGHSFDTLVQSVGESGAVYGIELSEGMICQARSRSKSQGIDRSVNIVQGDAMDLPFKQAVFDGIFISFTLEIFGDDEIQNVLERCKRCLRSDGQLCVVSMSKQGGNRVMQKAYEWSHRKFPKMVDCRPIQLSGAIKEAGLLVKKEEIFSLAGIGCEVVLARKNTS
jgi:ubiquinone/menaquinone biosynthesis C-methylase UbiE